jgi:hypothetical protein
MSQLKSGASADLLTVGATSKALNVSQYEYTGEVLDQETALEYTVSADMIWSLSGGGSGAYQFILRNTSSTKIVKMNRINLIGSFYGTAAANNQQFTVNRYANGYFASVSAGISLSITPENSGSAASICTAFMNDGTATTPIAATALNTASQLPQTLFNMVNPRSVTGKKTTATLNRDFELKPGETLGIISTGTGVVGDTLNAILYWQEI